MHLSNPAGRLVPALGLAACAAAPAGPPAASIASFDGVPLAYDSRGSGEPALVLVHGWCGRRSQWAEVTDELAQGGRVVALDLAGHGDSGHARTEWTLDALAGDVVAVVEALGLERCVLVGHSLGGPVCLLAAARLPERVIGVVGIETLQQVEYEYEPGSATPVVAALERDYRSALERCIRAALPVASDPALAERLIADARTADRNAAIALLPAYADFDPRPTLRACPVPVRCINSARPIATDVAGARRYAPSFEAVILARTGHFPMVEAPGEFAAHLRSIATELAARPVR